MGWWSGNIMGGDPPLDCIGFIAEYCGVKFDEDAKGEKISHFQMYPFTRKIVEDNVKGILDNIKNDPDWYDTNISTQVVGMLVMYYGAKFPRGAKSQIIQAAHDDEWAKDDGPNSERGKSIRNFVEQLYKYKPGQRYYQNTEGEFLNRTPNSVRFIVGVK